MTETDLAETEHEIHEQDAEEDVPEIVLEDVDNIGEWHTSCCRC